MAVELLSPIPPMNTGTADYFEAVVRRVAAVPGCAELMKIYIDPNFLPRQDKIADSLHGARIYSTVDLPLEVPVGSTRILFLANNDHHAYVHAALARQRSLACGRVVTVLHDPAVFMVNRFMTSNGEHRTSWNEVRDSASIQYGMATDRLIDSRLEGTMPDIFEFVTHCQKPALTKSHEIWVHSIFALAKLICESAVRARQFPKIRVCAHPAPEGAELPPPGADTIFRIGVFGWVTPPKRVTAIIRGLALALDRLGPEAFGKIELMIVGRSPSDSPYDPEAEAARYDLRPYVRFVKNLAHREFVELQRTCQLIFNLRFPSCGETSGTLATADRSGAAVITSRYQAFNETSIGRRTVTVLPDIEAWDIGSAICEAYQRFKEPQPRPIAHPPSSTSEICPIEKLILMEVLRYRNLHSPFC